MKAGFKHEMHFNNLNENVQTESLSWGVDSNVQVGIRRKYLFFDSYILCLSFKVFVFLGNVQTLLHVTHFNVERRKEGDSRKERKVHLILHTKLQSEHDQKTVV